MFEQSTKKLEKLGYITEGRLTEKGKFASKIYSDEILTGELFATNFHQQLNSYQIMLLVSAICYEARERTQFHKTYPSEAEHNLEKALRSHPYAGKDKRFAALRELTAMLHPCYEGMNIFDIVKNTSLLEGDIIRFFRQVLDRTRQIRLATDNNTLISKLHDCEQKVKKCLQDVDMV